MASRQRTGVAAILAGALYFAGQGGELVFNDTAGTLWLALGVGGFIALAVALWGLRELVGSTRMGRVGIRMALGGAAFLCLFAVQLVVEELRTGDLPDNFLLFLIGFLLILAGQVLFARDLRPVVGRAWLLPIAAVLGLVLALFLNSVGLHDIGLFVFEAAWVGLGLVLLRRAETAPSPAATVVT